MSKTESRKSDIPYKKGEKCTDKGRGVDSTWILVVNESSGRNRESW